MNQIKFSHNWNGKLDNKFFTSIRSYNEKKEEYYVSKLGEEFRIILRGKVVDRARLIFVESRRIDDICRALLITDTGTDEYMDIFGRFGIDETDEVLILTFKKEVKQE